MDSCCELDLFHRARCSLLQSLPFRTQGLGVLGYCSCSFVALIHLHVVCNLDQGTCTSQFPLCAVTTQPSSSLQNLLWLTATSHACPTYLTVHLLVCHPHTQIAIQARMDSWPCRPIWSKGQLTPGVGLSESGRDRPQLVFGESARFGAFHNQELSRYR